MEEKYRPESLKEFLIPVKTIKECRNWIKDKESRRKALFISGDIGCGKSSFAAALAKDAGMSLYVLSSLNIKSKSTLKSIRGEILNSRDVITGKQKVLLIDDIDIIVNSDKGFLAETIQTVKQNADGIAAPIIFTSAKNDSKKINELKRNCICIEIPVPTNLQMKKFIGNIAAKESIKFVNPTNGKSMIATKCSGDFRRVFFVLEFLKKTTAVSMDDIKLALETVEKRQIDHSVFDITEKILNEKMSFDQLMNLYDSEKTLLPLMLFENYTTVVSDIDDFCSITDSLSMSDTVDHAIYSNQVWDMFEIHGFFSTIVPAYHIAAPPKIPERKYERAAFTKLLTRSSIRATRRKNIAAIRDIFKENNINLEPEPSIHNRFHTMMSYCKKYIETNDIQTLVNYLSEFDLNITHFETINKITKIGSKGSMTISPNLKKQIKEEFKKIENTDTEITGNIRSRSQQSNRNNIYLEKGWKSRINTSFN